MRRICPVARGLASHKPAAGPGAAVGGYAGRGCRDGRLAHAENADGGRSSTTLSAGGSTTGFALGTHDFTYDTRGLLATHTDFDGTYRYGYDELGRNTRLVFPDAHVRVQRFDDLGRITSRCYEYADPTLNRCYAAQYDPVGNPLVLSDPEGSDLYAYDALDRLTRVTRRDLGGLTVSTEDYAFNALGALSVKAGLPVDHRRPRLDGAGSADAAVPATLDALPVGLDLGGRVTSLRGLDLAWNRTGELRRVGAPVPTAPVNFGFDSYGRRVWTVGPATVDPTSVAELYQYEGVNRIAALERSTQFTDGVAAMMFAYDGVDHPLRIAGVHITGHVIDPVTSRLDALPFTIAYYELDLAGSVRRFRAPGGADLGGYRYSAYGELLDDTVHSVPANLVDNVDVFRANLNTQPLRWKGMWRFNVGGTELYDARARMWSPALGSFLSVDAFSWHDASTTLWGWPGQSPTRWRDPFGRGRGAEDSRSGFNQFLFDLSPSTLDATAGVGTGLLDNIPLFPIQGSPTLGDLAAAGGLSGQHPARAGMCGGGGGDNSAANAGRLGGRIAGGLAIGLGAGAASGARGATRLLFHGTDAASANSILKAGLSAEGAAALGGGDTFWATAERSAADFFASANPANGAPAVLGISVPESVISSLERSGDLVVNGAVHEFSGTAWEVLNEFATITLVH